MMLPAASTIDCVASCWLITTPVALSSVAPLLSALVVMETEPPLIQAVPWNGAPLRPESLTHNPLTSISASSAYLFKPEEAIRARINSNWDQPFSIEVPHASNVPYGAIVDYYLSHEPSGPIQLKVFDSKGNLVRTISSTLPPPMWDEAQQSGVHVTQSTRGLVFNADMASVIRFLNIGTQVSPKNVK